MCALKTSFSSYNPSSLYVGYRASFAFTGQTEDDLAFDEGDIIHVTWAEDSGWWYGSVNGQEGWFPGGFVEVRTHTCMYMQCTPYVPHTLQHTLDVRTYCTHSCTH